MFYREDYNLNAKIFIIDINKYGKYQRFRL